VLLEQVSWLPPISNKPRPLDLFRIERRRTATVPGACATTHFALQYLARSPASKCRPREAGKRSRAKEDSLQDALPAVRDPATIEAEEIDPLPSRTAMAALLQPVTALLIATGVLLMGNGLLGVLLPLRADIDQFSRLEIGVMGSCFYAGLMAGCLFAPLVIARVGHIRAFVAFTAIVTVTPLLHAMWPQPLAWSALRTVTGLCFAGLFTGIESWLSGASEPEARGRVLAAYTVVNLTVVTIGMQLTVLAGPKGFELFSLVAILYSLAAVPVAMAATSAPNPPPRAKLRLGWLISVSPAAVAGCFLTGYVNGAFWALAPLYARSAGLSLPEISIFMAVAVLAGAASQWPIGHLSDRAGRRPLLVVVGIVAMSAGIALYLLSTGSPALIFALAAVYGTCAFQVYTLCVAHANDLVHKKRAIEVSSGLLLTFSLGAILGPLAASVLMSKAGHGALFLNSAAAHGLIAAVMLVRTRLRPRLPAERSEVFVAVPRTTPAVFELDPRAEPAREPV
jgi:MFS family permease